MSGTFEDKLLGFIHSNGLFEEIGRVLLAVSGGADSMAMAYILNRLRQQGGLSCDFVIGHVNHCLRGSESDGDEVFVQSLADSLSIPFAAKTVNVKAYAKKHKLSIETAGRIGRLQHLARMAHEHDCGCIATAHHADDLAETMLHRLMRGTGFRGLCGIWPVSEVYGAEFVRPMLGLRRADIIRYCRDNSIRWREDASNADTNFTRNRIRHRLLPALGTMVGTAHPTSNRVAGTRLRSSSYPGQAAGPADVIVEKLEILSRSCRRFQLLTEKRAQAIVQKGDFDLRGGQFSIQQELLIHAAPWIFYEVIREVLVRLGVGLRRYQREHFESVRRLAGKKRASLVLPAGVVVWAMEDRLLFLKETHAARSQRSDKAAGIPVQLAIGQSVVFGPWRISCRLLNRAEVDVETFMKTKDAFVEWFDADKIAGPIIIRSRRDGDRFQPIGTKSSKKIARFLQDAQLDGQTRQNAFIIADTEKILWLAPLRIAEPVKVTEQTKHILEIRAGFSGDISCEE